MYHTIEVTLDIYEPLYTYTDESMPHRIGNGRLGEIYLAGGVIQLLVGLS
jgi:hypothetical protein